MVSRLRVIFLGLGRLSTVMGCAVAPPAMPPPVLEQWPRLQRLRLQTPRLQWLLFRMDTLSILQAPGGQTSTNPHHTSRRWMRKNSNTGDNGVPRSGNRSRDISSGNKNQHGSGTLAMNGCGDLILSLSSLDDHRPLVTAVIPDSGRRLAHIVRESRSSPRPLWRTVNGETVGVP